MLTIIALINFAGSLFNCAICIYIFSLVDDLEFKPEKSTELSDTILKYFPIEFMILCFNVMTAIFLGNWFQIVVCLPLFIYNLQMYLFIFLFFLDLF